MLEVIEGRQVSIQMGKIPDQFVTLPKFSVRFGLPSKFEGKPFICIGRLYQGYVGAYITTPLFVFSVLIHKKLK